MSTLTERVAALASCLFATATMGCGKPDGSTTSAESARSAVQPSSAVEPASFLPSLRAAFRRENQRLDEVEVVEARSVGARAGSVILAYAVRADHNFSGDFKDEMFGIFHALPGADTVLPPIALIPTPRWRDYQFRFEVIAPDSIVLTGKDGYGQENPHVTRWRAPEVEPYVRPEDRWLEATIVFTDTLATNLYDQPGGKRVPVELRFKGRLEYGMRVLEVRDNWFRVAVWVPSLPGCDNDLTKPLTEDTLWTPLLDSKGRRLLRRDAGMIC